MDSICELFTYPAKYISSSILKDILDGRIWQDNKDFLAHPGCLGIQLSTDGGSKKTRGAYSMWPLVITIINLPPNVRNSKDFTMLVSMIPTAATSKLGNKKRNNRREGKKVPIFFCPFLQPMLEEFLLLETGIPFPVIPDRFQDIPNFQLKACLLLFVADSPATTHLTYTQNHGNENSCWFCNMRVLKLKRCNQRTKVITTVYYP